MKEDEQHTTEMFATVFDIGTVLCGTRSPLYIYRKSVDIKCEANNLLGLVRWVIVHNGSHNRAVRENRPIPDASTLFGVWTPQLLRHPAPQFFILFYGPFHTTAHDQTCIPLWWLELLSNGTMGSGHLHTLKHSRPLWLYTRCWRKQWPDGTVPNVKQNHHFFKTRPIRWMCSIQ